MRSLRVKFILPALTEATSPYWRPIKYSLFPPLGLATLAAYLGPDDEAVIVRRARRAAADSTTAPTSWSIQVYITNALSRVRDRGPLPRAGAFVALGGLHVTSLPGRSGARTPTRSSSARASRHFRNFSTTFARGEPRRVRVDFADRTLDRCRRSAAI